MTVSATLISAVGFNNSNFTRYLTATLLTYVPGTSTTVYGNVFNNQVISWNFPTFATAYSAASLVPSSIYQSGVTATVASISTLYFAFSATSYNDTTTSYTLCSLPITCTFASNVTSYTSPTGYNQIFDTFPNINLATYINYESTNNSPFFYRLTSTNSFPVTAYFTSPSFNSLIATAPLVPSLSTNLYGAVGTINNVLTAFSNLTAVQKFNAKLVGLSSVGIILTAVSGTNSFAPWYTPHTFTQNLSVSFVPYYLSAGFIGFPDTVFSGFNVLPVNSSNYTSPSATLTFLGEGHTANITLSAINDSHASSYSWNILDNTFNTGLISLSTLTTQTSAATSVKGYDFNTIYQFVSTLGVPASSSITSSVSASDGDYATNTWTVTYSGYPNNFSNTILTSYSTITASVSTTPANSNIIPITLQLSDNKYFALSSNPPIVQYDDNTGKPSYYPFYTSTLDTFGNEATATNNGFHQSIIVTTYDVSSYVLYVNIPNTFPSSVIPSNNQVYLPVPSQPFTNNSFGSPIYYQSSLTNISSVNTLPCYDTAGGNLSGSLFWTWAALSSTALNNLNKTTYPLSSQSVIPSSWSMTQCLSTVVWNGTDYHTLSTVVTATSGMFAKTWRYQGAGINAPVSPVSLLGGGITWSLITNNWVYPTVPYTNNATTTFNWTLQLSGAGTAITNTGGTVPLYQNTPVTVQAQQTITASVLSANNNVNYDWQPRNILITPSVTLTSIGLPLPTVYTPNRFVLTGSNIPLQNVSTNSTFITAVSMYFDNTLVSVVTGNPYNNTIVTSSSSIGYKNVTLISNTYYPNLPVITSSFPNIVDVVTQYDDVEPIEYRSLNSPISLPWTVAPKIGANDWVTDNNINSCITKIYDNLEYLNILGKSYFSSYSDYFGYLCPINYSTIITTTTVTSSTNINVAYCPHWTWENLNTAITPSNNITWTSLSGTNVPCGTWLNQTCGFNNATPSVTTATTSTTATTLTSIQGTLFCNAGNWNVNIPGLDANYGTVNNGNYVNTNCIYTGIISKNNNLYTSQSTQINLLSSDYLATVYSVRNTTDGKKTFSSIVNLSLDSNGKIFVLDSNLSQVVTLVSDTNNNWYEFNNWGGFGFASSKFKFNMPGDIHVDQLDNVWVCDTGNNVIKQYTNTGSWLLTISDSNLASHPPLSLAVDSQKNVHVLTVGGILVYNYNGDYQYTYSYSSYASSTNPRRINTSYNREVIYVAFDTQVLKFFRTGTFNGYIIQSLANVTNINSLYQDEFRNLLIVSDNIILKFPDLMQLTTRQSSLPTQYWTLNDLLIHKEEYVQNWVYNKSFERLWDNIELFRNALQYSSGNCLSYTAPIHSKNKMIIGQNEIVTSTTVNRVLGYLWDNFYTLVKFFDPNCIN